MHVDGKLSRVSLSELTAHQKPFEVQFQAKDPAFCNSLESAIPTLKGKTVFLGFHGTEGEDGTIQAMFEAAKIPFTGSGAEASRVCFDKLQAKTVLQKHGGVLTAAQVPFEKSTREALISKLEGFFAQHGRIVVKPTASGSSFGLQFINDKSEIAGSVDALLTSPYQSFLAEKFVKGRELTVGVHETRDGLRPMPPSEVVLNAGHSFDYQGKYLGRGTTEITPAQLTQSEREAAQELAMIAHRALGCAGYTRTDMILTEEGPVFLETNTLPGMTRASFVPQQLAADGISVKSFIEEQLENARRRYES